jgi:hypothetical protein
VVYTDPDVEYIVTLTGIHGGMLGLSDSEFESRLGTLLPGARYETIARVTQTRFDDSNLDPYEVGLLQDAVSFRVAGRFLRGPAARKASGTNVPTWQVDANQLTEQRLENFAEARKLEGLFIGGSERLKVLARPRG